MFCVKAKAPTLIISSRFVTSQSGCMFRHGTVECGARQRTADFCGASHPGGERPEGDWAQPGRRELNFMKRFMGIYLEDHPS